MTCEELESRTPGRALADPAIGDPKGRVFVEFATETPAGDSGYDPRSVEQRSSMPAMVPTIRAPKRRRIASDDDRMGGGTSDATLS